MSVARKARKARRLPYGGDWTRDRKTGRSNSSARFLKLVDEVARMIRDDARSLMSGRADLTARLILAQLAHKHGLGPVKP